MESEDWCAEGRKRVEDGSDGLWVRCGVASDGSCLAGWFHFEFNPCVSLCSLLILFGLVGLCSVPPGEFCSSATTTYIWNDKFGTKHEMQARGTPQKGDPRPPGGSVILEPAGSANKEMQADMAAIVTAIPINMAEVMAKKKEGKEIPEWAKSLDSSEPKFTSGPINVQMWQFPECKKAHNGLCAEWAWTADLNTYEGKVETRLQAKECFMPKLEFAGKWASGGNAKGWMDWATENFTWLYVLTQDVWIVFLFWVAYKYGKVKMGRDDELPEFSDFAFFSMLFTCGVATGLFFYAVTEPQYYYLANKEAGYGSETNAGYYEHSRYTYSGVAVAADGTESGIYTHPNKRAQDAMTLTFYHWGLHGWVVYALVGVMLGLMHFRKGMPMTIKTCFYPLFGCRIYGMAGDFVDTVSVVATTMGVCTSLGMGVMQLDTGIEYLNGFNHYFAEPYYNQFNKDKFMDNDGLKEYWDQWESKSPWFCSPGEIEQLANKLIAGFSGCDPSEACFKCSPDGGRNWQTAANVANVITRIDQQMFWIVIVSVCAISSVMLGMQNGLKNVALVCFVLGQFVIFYVWMMDDTWFITNLLIQSIGDYMWKLPVLGFYCSAIEQTELNNPYGEYKSWQRWWTVFYWGWWIAWAPFVGVFMARITRGRTIREFIFASMGAAVLYNFVFLCILGGAGMRMQILAEKHGVGSANCDDSGTLYGQVVLPEDQGGTTQWVAVDQLGEQPYLDTSTIFRVHPYKKNVCRSVSTAKYSGEREMYCSQVTNIACSMKKMGGAMPLFDVMDQYGEMGRFMVGFTLVALTLYFIASSDSGSMVDDMVCANGVLDPNLIQRFLWASTECIAACALLNVGKYVGGSPGSTDGPLRALRAMSIVVGVPWTFFAMGIMVAMLRALQYETGERKWGADCFKSSIMDVGFSVYDCAGKSEKYCCNFKLGKFNGGKFISNVIAGFAPIVPLMTVANRLNDEQARRTGKAPAPFRQGAVVLFSLFFWAGWILIFIDLIPSAEDPTQWGSIQGNVTHPGGNSEYYMSTRAGYYRQWGNEGSLSNGDVIQWNLNLAGDTAKNNQLSIGEVSIADHGSSDIADITTGSGFEPTVGERITKSRRFATIGWFLLLALFNFFLTACRSELRKLYSIPGNLVEDYCCACLWPTCLTQMAEQCDEKATGGAAPAPPPAYSAPEPVVPESRPEPRDEPPPQPIGNQEQEPRAVTPEEGNC